MLPGETDEFNQQFDTWKKSRPPLSRNGLVEKLRLAARKLQIPPGEFEEYIKSIEDKLNEHQKNYEEKMQSARVQPPPVE